MGIYYRPVGSSSNKKLDAYHADTSFTMPMDLYLYNYYGENSEQIFEWNPNEEQWWITGFNPEHVGKVDVHKQVMVGSVDFSGLEELYENLINTMNEESDYYYNERVEQFIIPDDVHHKIWLCWY